MNVLELKKVLENIPDDAVILAHNLSSSDNTELRNVYLGEDSNEGILFIDVDFY